METHVDFISPVPDSLEFDRNYYKKYVDASGIPVVAAAEVDSFALLKAKRIIEVMVSKHDPIRRLLANNVKGFLIIPKNREMTTLPAYVDMDRRFPLPCDEKWDKRAQGCGWISCLPYVSCSEANLLKVGRPLDRYPRESICIHEFAHAVMDAGILVHDPGFDDRLNALYKDAKEKYLGNSYAGQNPGEYWAVGVQAWFNAADCVHKGTTPTDTFDKLHKTDPSFACEVGKWFPSPYECSPVYP
ncbi:hypothetical protein AB4Y32_39510 [Paraburkholderia phymatum]|uniref:Uncharacterized protein n=1 Tax=Paraburkholderia phymatum TaxID=148447 RepID=A0ACC6UDV5_9BURK